MKLIHKGELQAVEDKYEAQKKIQMALEAQVLDLHSRLGQSHKPVLVKPEGKLFFCSFNWYKFIY